MQRLSEYNPLEIKCDDAASRADVIEFVTAVLAAEPARLQGNLLTTAVQIVQEKCQVHITVTLEHVSLVYLSMWIFLCC